MSKTTIVIRDVTDKQLELIRELEKIEEQKNEKK
jgi:hypothetical protein